VSRVGQAVREKRSTGPDGRGRKEGDTEGLWTGSGQAMERTYVIEIRQPLLLLLLLDDLRSSPAELAAGKFPKLAAIFQPASLRADGPQRLINSRRTLFAVRLSSFSSNSYVSLLAHVTSLVTRYVTRDTRETRLRYCTAQIARLRLGDNGHFLAIVCRLSVRAWLGCLNASLSWPIIHRYRLRLDLHLLSIFAQPAVSK